MSSARDRQTLDAELLAWMQEPRWQPDEARFEALALELFAHQFDRCSPYGRFARGRGLTPETVEHWREIPAVPAGAFKELPLRSFPESRTSKTFRTSGTSGQKRGELHLDTLALYEASLMASLDTLLMPDRASSKTTLRVLAPSGSEAPDSSLSHMFQVLVARRGSPDSEFDVVDGELRLEPLLRGLETAQSTGAPLVVCGTAFSFVHLLEALEARDLAFSCPSGSRIMETGGFKGRSREMSRAKLYAALTRRLGVPSERIVNQYGMTELGSQFYDSVWTDPTGPRRKLGPPWARVRFLDPETGRETQPGTPGMVVIHDLANTGSVAAIQTADLGRAVLDGAGAPIGFEILGRRPGAEARGCSIAADEMLARSA
ncbi:MAG: long-chain fatty acid--CoA ligase [Myxococcota bacterium]|nr:long-chain fatty acid--CoA ligase [Myxococcota bacterium]